jgi:hypothetical protein
MIAQLDVMCQLGRYVLDFVSENQQVARINGPTPV